MKKLKIAVVGLRYGGNYALCFAAHPNVEKVICADLSKDIRDDLQYWIDKEYYDIPKEKFEMRSSLEEIIEKDNVDGVFLATPIPLHAEQTLYCLDHGVNVCCAVPMATNIEDMKKICKKVQETGLKYMLAETDLYDVEFYMNKEKYERGDFGKIQYLRGQHNQYMDCWPKYWQGLPPMHYSCHIVAPFVGILNEKVKSVRCFGAGTMSEERVKNYNNPYPIEVAFFTMESGIKGDLTRMLFETTGRSMETYNIYGDKESFEGILGPVIVKSVLDEELSKTNPYDTLHPVITDEKPKNRHDLLPSDSLKRLTVENGHLDGWEKILDTAPVMWHGTAHTHIATEFVDCITENRKARSNEKVAANICAVGICAHESAMNNNKEIVIPEF